MDAQTARYVCMSDVNRDVDVLRDAVKFERGHAGTWSAAAVPADRT